MTYPSKYICNIILQCLNKFYHLVKKENKAKNNIKIDNKKQRKTNRTKKLETENRKRDKNCQGELPVILGMFHGTSTLLT